MNGLRNRAKIYHNTRSFRRELRGRRAVRAQIEGFILGEIYHLPLFLLFPDDLRKINERETRNPKKPPVLERNPFSAVKQILRCLQVSFPLCAPRNTVSLNSLIYRIS